MKNLQKTSTLSHSDWLQSFRKIEHTINSAMLGQESVVRHMLIATLSRGHILLQGDVGVGKTTLLKMVATAIGGQFERVEGTIDLMPHDLIYYTHITDNGKPAVDVGPVLKHGEALSIFFFNEINRARPHVHSLLLRLMAERSVTAFNKTYWFPHVQVFADRNDIEKNETFELPAAARDRFMMELEVAQPKVKEQVQSLMFNTRYHDADQLVDDSEKALVPYDKLNDLAAEIQNMVQASETLQDYGYHLCHALRAPDQYGIKISDVDTSQLIKGGMGPRGMSYLAKGARVNAWLNEREAIIPEDFHAILKQIAKHRIFLNSVYDYNRDQIINELITSAVNTVQAP